MGGLISSISQNVLAHFLIADARNIIGGFRLTQFEAPFVN
jgi:hypothetical protein